MTHTAQLRSLRSSLPPLSHGYLLAGIVATRLPTLGHTTALSSRRTRQLLPPSRSAAPVRLSSSSSAVASAAKPITPSPLTPTASNLSPTAANPPHTTRPPPLAVPVRDPSASTISHLFAIGKAYLTFYKTGLKYVYLNYRLLHSQAAATSLPRDEPLSPTDAAQPSPVRPADSTRAHLLLKQRVAHDIRKLPLFGLLLLVCGELTPVVVLALPHTVPYTCRIPRQVARLRREAEERRRVAFAELEGRVQAAGGREVDGLVGVHVARSLGLVSRLWDRIGWVPGVVARGRSRRRMGELARDDALLVQSGGVPALCADEVRLACEDRGIDVLERSDQELMEILARWLRLTRGQSEEERLARIETLLMRRVEEWPSR